MFPLKTPESPLPRRGYHYILDMEARDFQLGAVLIQDKPDVPIRPIVYFSR